MDVTEMNLLQSEKRMMRRAESLGRNALPLVGLLLLSSVGCKSLVADNKVPKKEKFPPIVMPRMQSPVGVPPVPQQPATAIDTLVFNASIPGSRPDPFATFPIENAYERKASNLRATQANNAFFPSLFTPNIPVIKVEAPEPQPFRRLAGVLVGDSVMAIIDMGDSAGTQVIRPGMQIPNSPWKVVWINETQAKLHRDGNKKPNDIIVTLQGPQMPGAGGGFGNPGDFGNGNPGGAGNPGRNPGGNRNGRGGKFGGGGGNGNGGAS